MTASTTRHDKFDQNEDKAEAYL